MCVFADLPSNVKCFTVYMCTCMIVTAYCVVWKSAQLCRYFLSDEVIYGIGTAAIFGIVGVLGIMVLVDEVL